MSSWDDLRLQVTPGSGLVARTAAALLVVPRADTGAQPALEQLLALVRGARAAGGRGLARRLAAIVASSEPDEVPDLALLADLGNDNVAVLVVGECTVTAETATGPVSLSGRDALTWIDRVLQAPTRILVSEPDGAEPVALPHADLVEGVVPGGGALLEARQRPASPGRSAAAAAAVASAPVASVDEDGEANPPSPSPSPPDPGTEVMPASTAPTEAAEDFEVGQLAAEPEPRAPLPVEPEPTAVQPAAGEPSDLVEGVYCKRGHFTDPDSPYCIVCGVPVEESKTRRKGVRPELGFLVFDDGSVFHLDHDYVLGRQPEVDADVKAGKVRALRLEDSGGTVSRAHAIVRLVGWHATIADRNSQNGTYVATGGGDDFVPVPADEPMTLVAGSRIQLGERTLVYETQRSRS